MWMVREAETEEASAEGPPEAREASVASAGSAEETAAALAEGARAVVATQVRRWDGSTLCSRLHW